MYKIDLTRGLNPLRFGSGIFAAELFFAGCFFRFVCCFADNQITSNIFSYPKSNYPKLKSFAGKGAPENRFAPF